MESDRFLEGSYPLLRTPSCPKPVRNQRCLTTIVRNYTRTAYHKKRVVWWNPQSQPRKTDALSLPSVLTVSRFVSLAYEPLTVAPTWFLSGVLGFCTILDTVARN